ncbi:MAG TPA: hypothetical protein VFR37_22860 [Longimicrobium sp.]|nr:hypothetical protein [Longimicrobium sp.]
MKKLKLDTAELRVESFAPVPEPRGNEGTVAAHEFTEATCNQFTCGHTCDPADLSCNGQFTCYGPRCPLSQYPTCIPVCQTGEIC